MRHILHKIALSPYTALSPIGPHCVPMGLNPSVVSFFFCSGRRRRLSPRPLCGSDPMQPEGPLAKVISIHAPRVGSDGRPSAAGLRTQEFQSTLPVWGATPASTSGFPPRTISIHAPRVGSDDFLFAFAVHGLNFNPRSPCGERPASHGISTHEERFQSTLPVWGATKIRLNIAHRVDISIHASRVGSDSLL